VSGPSNETEAETLERRKVEALERIAEALTTLARLACDAGINVEIQSP
jgi:hypothetical protein